MIETLTDGGGSREGFGPVTSIDGEPDPVWSEAERLAFEQDLADIERRVSSIAAYTGQRILSTEIMFSVHDSVDAQPYEIGPYKRLKSIGLSPN